MKSGTAAFTFRRGNRNEPRAAACHALRGYPFPEMNACPIRPLGKIRLYVHPA